MNKTLTISGMKFREMYAWPDKRAHYKGKRMGWNFTIRFLPQFQAWAIYGSHSKTGEQLYKDLYADEHIAMRECAGIELPSPDRSHKPHAV